LKRSLVEERSASAWRRGVCETQIAGDINGDCRVDDLDLDLNSRDRASVAFRPGPLPLGRRQAEAAARCSCVRRAKARQGGIGT